MSKFGDLAKSSKILVIFNKISARFGESLARSSQDLTKKNPNLIGSITSQWKNIWVGRFELLKFERRRTDI